MEERNGGEKGEIGEIGEIGWRRDRMKNNTAVVGCIIFILGCNTPCYTKDSHNCIKHTENRPSLFFVLYVSFSARSTCACMGVYFSCYVNHV